MLQRANLALVGLLVVTSAATAGTLTDLNAVLTYDVDVASTTGLGPWVVDLVTHMNTQWFWYRTGDMDREASINTLGPPAMLPTNGDFDAGDERLVVQYTANAFTITVDVVLTGGGAGSGWADVAEVVAVQNTGTEPLEFHLFQFCNPVINNTVLDDVGSILGGNTAYVGDVPGAALETVVAPRPDQYAIGSAATLLAALDDAATTDLGQEAGPVGPNANVAWALQWDVVLNPQGTFLMSADKILSTPEPATMALMGLGLTALVTVLRKRT